MILSHLLPPRHPLLPELHILVPGFRTLALHTPAPGFHTLVPPAPELHIPVLLLPVFLQEIPRFHFSVTDHSEEAYPDSCLLRSHHLLPLSPELSLIHI